MRAGLARSLDRLEMVKTCAKAPLIDAVTAEAEESRSSTPRRRFEP